MHKNPIALLQQDWQRAISARDANHNVCTLCTTEDNQPHARILILRDISAQGLLLFTNANSPKWSQLKGSGQYALLLYWPSLGLQYRIRGEHQAYPRKQVIEAWNNKPYEAKLLDTFYESHRESRAIPNRKYLEDKILELKNHYPKAGDIPFPEGARGIHFLPTNIEYYELSPEDRLHKRFLYRREGNNWAIDTLVP